MKKILIANRGAAATRIDRAAKALGMKTVIVYSEADSELPYVRAAEESYCIGPGPALRSYLDQEGILDVLCRSGADALHPGYGFLSENAGFARKVEAAGKCFIGPSPYWLERLGDKAAATALMREHGLPIGSSSGVLPLDDPSAVAEAAAAIGYPVLIKPAKGGGGIGMIPVEGAGQLAEAWDKAASIATKAFSDAALYLEKFIFEPRHIEFQFLADRYGNVMSLYERDCSTQRRYQKVIEEGPAPRIPREELDRMAERLSRILSDIGYDVIGTVETLYSPATGFSFLEVNTRLQVEHAVTEAVTGVDIVLAQIQLAAGVPLSEAVPERPSLKGHAIEARIYAEHPLSFMPSPGVLKAFDIGQGDPDIRVETGYAQGCRVSSYYDPMVAKVIVHAGTRDEAIARLSAVLRAANVEGIKTNIPAIVKVLQSGRFSDGAMTVDAMRHVLAEAAGQVV
ncbi:biotin carboxylase [Alcaligenaceae bacterium]|nr:biotin carboxylase [Alcaligenaceae bacterium]